MAALSDGEIEKILRPFHGECSPGLLTRLSVYLDLLLRWNARMNLSAIREPGEMVRRHFGESLLAARYVPQDAASLLDLGSGAGFPGIPIQLAHPALRVTLAESQNKKAAFLREAVRVLGLETEVWAGRVETMPEMRRFRVVALRAVDDPAQALALARARLEPEGSILQLSAKVEGVEESVLIPGSSASFLNILR